MNLISFQDQNEKIRDYLGKNISSSFFQHFIQDWFICRLLDSTVLKDAGNPGSNRGQL